MQARYLALVFLLEPPIQLRTQLASRRRWLPTPDADVFRVGYFTQRGTGSRSCASGPNKKT